MSSGCCICVINLRIFAGYLFYSPLKLFTMNQEKFSVKTAENSVKLGYLRENWAEDFSISELIELDSGYYAVPDDITETACGCLFHTDLESDEYGFDELDEVYRPSCDIVLAYGRRGRELYTHEDNCVRVGGEYYVNGFLQDNDIVETEEGDYLHIDDAFYWDSDECYHSMEEEQRDFTNVPFSYHSGPRPANYVSEDSGAYVGAGIGMEIEKNALPPFDFERDTLHSETGATIERDSSVPDGFELVTPVYNLFSPKTLERLEALRGFCDVRNISGAGGHINFSVPNYSDEELLDACAGFLPLIYAMHRKRVENSFCTAKSIKRLKADGEKYQSVRLRGNYIEFRIFSAVKNFNSVLFRLELFQIIAKNLGASFIKVLMLATNKRTRLHKLLRRVYSSRDLFQRLISDAIRFEQHFEGSSVSASDILELNTRISVCFAGADGCPLSPDSAENVDGSEDSDGEGLE